MSIINAKRFIERIDWDSNFREQLHGAKSHSVKKQIIENEGFVFNGNSIQEACSSMLFLSSNREQQLRIRQLADWCKMVNLH